MDISEQKIQIIELSNSSINGTSSLLSTIILVAFLAFTLAIATRLYNKQNPNARFKDPNILNALTQNTMETVQYLMGSIVDNNIEKQVAKYNAEIDNLSESIKQSQSTAENIRILMSALNERIYNKFKEKIQSFNSFFENATTTATKIGKAMDNLNRGYTDIYRNYQERLSAYVDNLMAFMSKVADQITKATAIPSLFNMIAPLKKIYGAINRTLKNNQDFIKQNVNPDFVVPVDNYSSAAQTNLTTGFNATKSILTLGGYK